MPTSLDKPNYQPAPPSVQAHVPLTWGYTSTCSTITTRTLAKPLTPIHCPPSTTIRVIQGTLDPKSKLSSSETSITRDPSPTPTPPSRTFKSLSVRSKEKMSSVLTTPTRLRGKTLPADCKPHTPESEKDRDTDSVISFTPSMSSKHVANWFSGLLGGG
jgi:hypothetical protein